MADGMAIPEDLDALPRYEAWRRRRTQPALMLKIARAPWADAENLPDYKGWLKVAKRLDRKGCADRDPRYYMTRHLVDEVLFAAGGLERELNSLKDSVNSAQAHSDFIPGERRNPGAGQSKLVLNSALYATYAFINALTWGRSVRERVERNDPTEKQVGFLRSILQRKTKRPSPVRVSAGLLPSLADGQLKRRLQECLQELDPFLQESRRMANYALHAGAPQGPSTPTFDMRSNGQVFLRIPDKGTKRVAVWDEFTYRDGRDAVSYIQTLFDAVARFVDQMLDAFDALPEPF